MKYKFREGGDGYITAARGVEVLATPLLNKGTAFSAQERAALGLEGLLPAAVLSLDQQAERAYAQLRAQPSDLLKNVYWRRCTTATRFVLPRARGPSA